MKKPLLAILSTPCPDGRNTRRSLLRPLDWQSRGRRFDPGQLHQIIPLVSPDF